MSKRLKCILLDDEIPGLTYLRLLCEQIASLEVVKAFSNPVAFLQECEQTDFDLCILDIEMPGLSGLEVARLLNGKPVIFSTAYKEYAAEAYDLEAIDYIRKPITKERLEKTVAKATLLMSDNQPAAKQFVQLNTDKGKALLFFDQVVRITVSTADPRDKLAYLQSGENILLKNYSFEQLLELFPDTVFSRINRKDIISLKCIRYFTQEEVTISLSSLGGRDAVLPLGESYRAEFVARLK